MAFFPEQAHDHLAKSATLLDVEAFDSTEKAIHYRLNGLNSRWMLIPKERSEFVSVYINRQSRTLEWFPVTDTDRYFAGVYVGKRYLSGYSSRRGIASGCFTRTSLNPMDSHVLLLHCTTLEGFAQLALWYAGKRSTGPGEGPRFDERSGEGRYIPLLRAPQQPGPASVVTSTAADTPHEPAPKPHDDDGEVPSAPTANASIEDDSSAPGWMTDPRKRSAVEDHAVRLATLRYERLHFQVEPKGKPYDLLCTPTDLCPAGSLPVHVEVKGSLGDARTVRLTPNEVAHANASDTWRTDLYIVSQIELTASEAGEWIASGGSERWIEDWSPRAEDLAAVEFAYRVPD